MDKKTLLIVGMLLGFEKDHEIYDDLDWNEDTAGALLKAGAIKKEDIFSMAPNGKNFFEYKAAWNNFKKLIKFLKQAGQDVSLSDLRKELKDGKSAIDMAIEADAIDELFLPEIWAGNLEEMEKLWYSIDKKKREGKDFSDYKIAAARHEGITIREDELQTLGIKPSEVHAAIRNGNISEIREKLALYGNSFKMDDAKLCDSDGDHSFYTKSSWGVFEELVEEWEKNGEFPDAEFFQFSRGSQASIVEASFRHDSWHMIFNTKVFAGRPGELMKLYNSLAEDRQESIDIDKISSVIIEELCGDQITIDKNLRLEHLTTPLYSAENERETKNPVIGLGLEKIWENMDDVREALAGNGDRISLKDLRAACGPSGDNCLVRAARFGHFEDVINVLDDSGEKLQLSDLLAKKDSDGENLLDVIIENDQLSVLLQPELWVRRVDQLCEVWGNIPEQVQSEQKEAFRAAQTQANRLSLRALQEEQAGRTIVAAPVITPGGPS